MTADNHSQGPLEVPVTDLRPGMFVQDLGVRWAMHPFLFNQFKLDERAIRKLHALGIDRVWIDPARSSASSIPPQSATASQPPPAPQHEPQAPPSSRPAQKGKSEDQAGWSTAHEVTTQARRAMRELFESARAGKALKLDDTEAINAELSTALEAYPHAILAVGRIRTQDSYTYQHSVNVAVLMMAFATHLELPRSYIRTLGLAGMLHDIGKSAVPSELITKPGPLTDEEYETIKSHTWRGAELLRQTEGVAPAIAEIAEQHHERLDGTGYPYQLEEPQLAMAPRMAAIIDVYDAVTAIRAYHNGCPPTEGLRILMREASHGLDKQLTQRFVRCVGIYPPGTLVRLSTGMLGVVLKAHPSLIDRPVVQIVYDIRQQRMLDAPRTVDLSRSRAGHRVESYEDPEQWAVPPELFL